MVQVKLKTSHLKFYGINVLNCAMHSESKDISFVDLKDELKMLSTIVITKSKPVEILKLVKEHGFVPNV